MRRPVIGIIRLLISRWVFLRILDYNMYGLKVNEISRAVVEREAYDSGRHFVGLGNVFERFKKSQREIVFLVDDPERER